jgi:hypothetical protein
MAGQAAVLALDSIHSRAICDEIGDRLRIALGREAAEIPSFLARLVDRLAELDRVPAPSIVPSIGDISSSIPGAAAAPRERELARVLTSAA